MACFIVPVSEAIVMTIAEKIVKNHEDRTEMKECYLTSRIQNIENAEKIVKSI